MKKVTNNVVMVDGFSVLLVSGMREFKRVASPFVASKKYDAAVNYIGGKYQLITTDNEIAATIQAYIMKENRG